MLRIEKYDSRWGAFATHCCNVWVTCIADTPICPVDMLPPVHPRHVSGGLSGRRWRHCYCEITPPRRGCPPPVQPGRAPLPALVLELLQPLHYRCPFRRTRLTVMDLCLLT